MYGSYYLVLQRVKAYNGTLYFSFKQGLSKIEGRSCIEKNVNRFFADAKLQNMTIKNDMWNIT